MEKLKKNASITLEGNKLIKNTEVWAETMIELKKLFQKLQTDTKSILFTEETINDKVLKKLKKLEYVKDISKFI